MKKEHKSMSVRIDAETLDKLRTIAQAEGGTASRQALYWLHRAIEAYEKEKPTPGQV